MKCYYNENDKFAAQWLRNLMAAGKIGEGIVDERSITEVRPADLAGYERCHFFAGIAGWEVALQYAGWVDNANRNGTQRTRPEEQELDAGCPPRRLPVWTGSCPCQPFSVAGKRRGVADDRHLWPVWRDLIAVCRPPTIFGEQVASKDGRSWLAGVRADLEAMGYAVGAADLCAAGAGAPHIRQRLWWVADAEREQPHRGGDQGRGWREHSYSGGLGHTSTRRRAGENGTGESECRPWQTGSGLSCLDGVTRRTQPGVHPLAHGVPGRVGQLRAYGNAIVPQVAAEFMMAAIEAQGRRTA